MNIVIMEDESLVSLFIRETLEDLGHVVVGVFDNATSLLDVLSELSIDIVLMDIEINGKMDGLQCSRILRHEYSIPSIFITSYQSSTTINEAMDSSPLGYLIKPVSESEIEVALAIASKSLKKTTQDSPEYLEFNNYRYNYQDETLTRDGKLIKLSKKESKIINLLCKSYGNVVNTMTLTQNLWEDSNDREHSLRELVYRLRKKLPDLNINSMSKTGYYLAPSEESHFKRRSYDISYTK